jgi:serine/threonine protein kinase
MENLNTQFSAVENEPEPGVSLTFPYITSYPDEATGKMAAITYRERIHTGSGRETTAIFSAISENGAPLFIKFVTRYNAEAHRLLAKNGYAPNLLYHSEVAYGGTHTMVVMDRLDGHDMHGKEFEDADLLRVQQAKNLLHENNYVFGDLRPNNIFKPKNGSGVVLIDFDWCGRDGVDKYPPVINPAINWEKSVKRGGVMKKCHDNHLFELLRSM